MSTLVYKDRKSKAAAVYKKYKSILKGRVLDVGADELFLKKHLPKEVHYVGIGLGKNPKLIKVDLEKQKIPFKASSFDCVLCLDVLEHVDNIHEVFDELCRVSKRWVIISLPNPWSELINTIRRKKYSNKKETKFYGLPPEREEDRHKWFFSSTEAQNFVEYRAKKNNFTIRELIITDAANTQPFVTRIKQQIERALFYRKDLNLNDIYSGTLWWKLEKK